MPPKRVLRELPVIPGTIINLRPLVAGDAASICRGLIDRQVARWLPRIPRPYTIDNARAWVQETLKMAAAGTDYQFGVENRGTGEVIGMIGLNGVHWGDLNAEVGYWLARKYWGQGMMTEAVNLIEEFAFRRLMLRRLYAVVVSTNVASIAVMGKAGFTREVVWRESRRVGREYVDVYSYGILHTEYRSRAGRRKERRSYGKG